MATLFSMSKQLAPLKKRSFSRFDTEKLKSAISALKQKESLEEKEQFFDPLFSEFFHDHLALAFCINHLPIKARLLLKSLLLIDQKHLLSTSSYEGDIEEALIKLVKQLEPIEKFYEDQGGVIGYQVKVYEMIRDRSSFEEKAHYHPPPFQDISFLNPKTEELINEGLLHMPELAEIYPVGGAADRLGLVEKDSGENLPAARLDFLESNLLERLIRDLVAREYLYYKKFGKQLMTPVVLMTSKVKDGDHHVREICEKNHWFNRPKTSFKIFCQPLIPTFDIEGKWCLKAPFSLLLKPGGHGVLWRLAELKGVYQFLSDQGRKKALIRQINNPIAGVDYGLLAFTGYGFKHNRVFGFASCPRRVRANEGMNVTCEKKLGSDSEFALTNVEYCEFSYHGIEDKPLEQGGEFSKFPSNTNILFADLEALKKAQKKNPFPGSILNFRSDQIFDGLKYVDEKVARIETTMQNIADSFVSRSKKKSDLLSYLTFNQRRKTISVTKRKMTKKDFFETPQSCLYDFLQNGYDLLKDHCGFILPPRQSQEDFIENGPDFLLNYHPALGPLYTSIAKKISKGEIKKGSEMVLEIAELSMQNFQLDGSFVVLCRCPLGHLDQEQKLHFSERAPRCTLKNVTVKNKGYSKLEQKTLLDSPHPRKESLTLILNENSHFIASDLHFTEPAIIEVPPNTIVRALKKNDKLNFQTTKLSKVLG
ncbi:MAG: UTP--glucose-1-phosphate uridylyltransferase [Simkaniaceae bacterium]